MIRPSPCSSIMPAIPCRRPGTGWVDLRRLSRTRRFDMPRRAGPGVLLRPRLGPEVVFGLTERSLCVLVFAGVSVNAPLDLYAYQNTADLLFKNTICRISYEFDDS